MGQAAACPGPLHAAGQPHGEEKWAHQAFEGVEEISRTSDILKYILENISN